MRFTISSSELYGRLSAASKVLSAKNSMPILGNFLFNVRDDKLTVTASDGDKYFITSIPTIEQEGNEIFCVPTKTMMDSIKELAEQPLTFEYDPATYILKGFHQSGQFVIMAQDASAYPLQQEINPDAARLAIPCEVLLNGVTRCLFATATDEVRMVMTGVFFDIKQDCIIFAGTDGRKLVRNINRNVQPGMDGGFILPKKVANILKAVLGRCEEDIIINFDQEKAVIQGPDFELYFRLVEGNYPNYNAVIPVNNPFQATVDRLSLISALKRVGVFCNQSSGLMKLHLENNLMQISGQDLDYSTSAEENLMCDYNNSPISIGFSWQYMEEIANILPGETITVQLADPSRPGVITPGEPDPNDDVIMLLMPMMLSD